MKRILLIILSVWAMLTGLPAQELMVKSMSLDAGDLSASTYGRKDLNGAACALVKVQLAANGARFEGNVIGDVAYKTGEYWVYMTDGSRELRIKHPNYLPLHVNFASYGIDRGVKSKQTYTLTLLMPQAGGIGQKQKLIINYSPANATVLIDSKLYKGNGYIETSLSIGTHQYIIAADGYATAEATVKLTSEAPRTVTEQLAPVTTEVQQIVSSPSSIRPTSGGNRQVDELINKVAEHLTKSLTNAIVTYSTGLAELPFVKCTYETGLLFNTGRAQLTSMASSCFTELCNVISSYSNTFDVAIDAYSDNTGNPKINQKLTESRAQAVASWLSANRPNMKIIQTKGHGESNPVAENSTAAGRAKNRRIEITLYPNEAIIK